MKTLLAWLTLVASLSLSGISHADDIPLGKVIKIESRGATVPIYAIWKDDAVASVVLYSGGGGGYGRIGEDGWPSSANFLIRSGKLFAGQPFNVIMVGRASDVATLDGVQRISDEHDLDNQAIFRAIKLKNASPIWLVGTSMGTISATAAAVRDGGRLVAGLVLTSSVTASRVRGAVPTQDLEKILVPVLVVHHVRDACKVCTPYEAKNITSKLKNSPIKKTVLLDGGSGESGDPCEALHHHGFIGMEKEAVDLIAGWIQKPTN